MMTSTISPVGVPFFFCACSSRVASRTAFPIPSPATAVWNRAEDGLRSPEAHELPGDPVEGRRPHRRRHVRLVRSGGKSGTRGEYAWIPPALLADKAVKGSDASRSVTAD